MNKKKNIKKAKKTIFKCLHCNTIKDKDGNWQNFVSFENLDLFLKSKNQDIDVSYGICPDCYKTIKKCRAG